MPGAAFHSFYWAEDAASQGQSPIGSSASGGYVPWQTTVQRLSVFCSLALAVRWAPSR